MESWEARGCLSSSDMSKSMTDGSQSRDTCLNPLQGFILKNFPYNPVNPCTRRFPGCFKEPTQVRGPEAHLH